MAKWDMRINHMFSSISNDGRFISMSHNLEVFNAALVNK
jgi:hypothetical protein